MDFLWQEGGVCDTQGAGPRRSRLLDRTRADGPSAVSLLEKLIKIRRGWGVVQGAEPLALLRTLASGFVRRPLVGAIVPPPTSSSCD